MTATVDPGLTEAWECFLRDHHIPALLATGCFRGAVLSRVAPGRYRMRYDAAERDDLERYLASHAGGLREEFTSRFPAGVTLEREVVEVLQVWNTRG